MKLIRVPPKSNDDRPFLVIWEVTQACDLACSHCRANAMPNSDPRALNFEQGKALIDQVHAFGAPYPLIVFTGGDPFKRADLFQLIEYASSLGLSPAVSPSATPLLTRERLASIRAAGAKVVSLSLDGSCPEVHDRFRGVEGTFQRTLQGCQDVHDVGLKLQINSTVSRHNVHELDLLASLVYQQQVMTWSLFFLVPTGRAQAEQALSPEEFEAVLHWMVDLSEYIPLKATEGHHYKRVLLMRKAIQEQGLNVEDYFTLHPIYRQLSQSWQALVAEHGIKPRTAARRTPMHINSGDGFVFVSHLGDVFPSGFLPLRAGNVKEDSLANIYRYSPLFGSLRDPSKLEGRCHDCEFNQLCGGSRSRAYAVTGNPFAEEPSCSYIPGQLSPVA